MHQNPQIWLKANKYLFPKRRAYGGKILLFSLLALSIALWITFPTKGLPDPRSRSERFTLIDPLVHETLSDRVMQGPAVLPCCAELDFVLWIEDMPSASSPTI